MRVYCIYVLKVIQWIYQTQSLWPGMEEKSPSVRLYDHIKLNFHFNAEVTEKEENFFFFKANLSTWHAA